MRQGGDPRLLIPVLVTGIQQRRVCGARESSSPKTWADWIPVTSTGMRDWEVRRNEIQGRGIPK
ncbi:hypothetical protein CFBP6625_00725 [Agrobacterium tumefaciens]|nr:hypothetical protein CFBP6625_00725 [Agrobacterium tumefaciens]